MPQHHVSRPRGSDLAPRSVFVEGRFGRLFRNLPGFTPGDSALEALAARMAEGETAPPATEGWAPSREPDLDSDIPAGYTYLGQFIDHDITFDPVSSLQRQNDPEGLHNFRTPRFDLDSLYGAGPNNSPFMYDPSIDGGRTAMLIGQNANGEFDLPRNVLPAVADRSQGRALIGDPRNDENVLVSQLHTLFLRFHNKVLETVRSEQPSLGHDELFEETQRVVRWHYQWIVVNDFLPRIVGPETVQSILNPMSGAYGAPPAGAEVAFPRFDLRFFRWQEQPFMPVEFSVAAYRFGHSMIRPTYKINQDIPELPIFSPSEDPGPLEALHGFRPLPSKWRVDWKFFFESSDLANMQVARRIDSKLAIGTFNLPETGLMRNLAARNLKRARALSLPSGQRVARAMGIEPLSDEKLAITDISEEFVGNAPLWFYVLKEAELPEGGSGKLGPLGGRLVAEVLLGLLKGDPMSYANVEPGWTPSLGSESFAMSDLISFVDG